MGQSKALERVVDALLDELARGQGALFGALLVVLAMLFAGCGGIVAEGPLEPVTVEASCSMRDVDGRPTSSAVVPAPSGYDAARADVEICADATGEPCSRLVAWRLEGDAVLVFCPSASAGGGPVEAIGSARVTFTPSRSARSASSSPTS